MTTDNKQSVLTNADIAQCAWGYFEDHRNLPDFAEPFARAVEQAVLSKLRQNIHQSEHDMTLHNYRSTTAFDDLSIPHPEDDADVAARGVGGAHLADDTKVGILADSSYLEGVKTGYSLGLFSDAAKYQQIINSISRQLREARAEVAADREKRADDLTIAYMAGAQAEKDRQQRDRESLQAVAKQMYLALCEENAAYDEPIHHVVEAIRVYEDHSSAALSAQEGKQ